MEQRRHPRRYAQKRAHRHSHEKKNKHIAGKFLAVLQFLLSAVFIIIAWNSGMVPVKYIAAVLIVLLVLFGIAFGLQFPKNKIFIAGIIISVITCIGLAFGIFYMTKANQLLANVGGATYKTDNMVVVVKKDDPAESLLDAENYRFGFQTATDAENNRIMREDIETAVGRKINVIEWDTLQEEAQALLDGKIEAAVYNEAFTGIIADAIEGYEDKVRILYQYGINTPLEQEEADVSEPFNVYISGIDVAGPITTNSRSDVNIIMTVNPNTKRILLTTTPRDYYVTLPGISGESRDKLTHAGIYGVDVSMATLEQIYNIDITYYARVNFTSLIKIVDALDGVDVNSEYDFEAGGFTYYKGMNHLNGEQALAFSRERYSFAAGDNQRGKNQEAVLTAILNKAMSPAILTNAGEILSSVSDSVETNMSQQDMAKFINMQLSDGASWTIESLAASGTGDMKACFSSGSQPLYVMWPDEAVIADIQKKMQTVLTQ